MASPPACTTRGTEWAPSRPSVMRPSTLSKRGHISMSSRTRSGPSLTSTCTASSSQRPAPAATVSWKWSSVESGGPNAAAIPPWARKVVVSSSVDFVSRPTRQRRAAPTAAVRPAIPPPSTRTSNVRLCSGSVDRQAMYGRVTKSASSDRGIRAATTLMGPFRHASSTITPPTYLGAEPPARRLRPAPERRHRDPASPAPSPTPRREARERRHVASCADAGR